MVQTRRCKVNPIKIIPSAYHKIQYHPFTNELYKNGKRHGLLRNKIYSQKVKYKQIYSFWNKSVIEYFHPKKFIFIAGKEKYTISLPDFLQFAKTKDDDPDTLLIELAKMKKRTK